MKRAPILATVGRLVCYALVVAAYVMALAALSGCGLLTDAMQAAGIPVGGASEAAKQVDAAISGWIDALLWGAAGAASSETTRAAHRTIKKRRAKKAAQALPTH